MYRYLLIDNDDTLMDFRLAECHALGDVLRRHGIPDGEDTLALYHGINQALWKALERGETTQAKLKVERFRQLLAALGREEGDAALLGEDFSEALGRYNFLLPGAEDFLRRVSAAMPVAMVTNGLSRIQRSRLAGSPLTPMLSAVIISEEAGVAKPDPRLAFLALEALGCKEPREAVLLGDSLTSDIGCARAAGIDSIWLAPAGKESDLPTWTAHSLDEAARILLGA